MTGSIPDSGMGVMIIWSQLALLIAVISKIVERLAVAQYLHNVCTR